MIIWIPVVVARMDLGHLGSEWSDSNADEALLLLVHGIILGTNACTGSKRAYLTSRPGAYPGAGRQQNTAKLQDPVPVQLRIRMPASWILGEANATMNPFSSLGLRNLDPGVEQLQGALPRTWSKIPVKAPGVW
jgi:hypothetical protein